MDISNYKTPVYLLEENDNRVYVKRDDLLPFSFGGNKARKAALFLQDIRKQKADYICSIRGGEGCVREFIYEIIKYNEGLNRSTL